MLPVELRIGVAAQALPGAFAEHAAPGGRRAFARIAGEQLRVALPVVEAAELRESEAAHHQRHAAVERHFGPVQLHGLDRHGGPALPGARVSMSARASASEPTTVAPTA
jgi:hypothetical protein